MYNHRSSVCFSVESLELNKGDQEKIVKEGKPNRRDNWEKKK